MWKLQSGAEDPAFNPQHKISLCIFLPLVYLFLSAEAEANTLSTAEKYSKQTDLKQRKWVSVIDKADRIKLNNIYPSSNPLGRRAQIHGVYGVIISYFGSPHCQQKKDRDVI